MPTVLVSLDKLKDPHSGLGQFSLDLGRSLIEASAPGFDLAFLVPRRHREPFRAAGVSLVDVHPFRKETLRRIVRPMVPAGIRGYRAVDVWHAPHQDAKYLPFDSRVPVVLTIHDLNFLREREPREVAGHVRSLQHKVDRAAVVTTVSAFSAGEIERHLDLRNKPVQVIPNGLSAPASLPSRPAGVPEGPFLFSIGHVVPRKNLAVLVPFMKRLPDISLVIAGRNTGSYARRMVSLAQKEGVANRMVTLGTVTADERQWLYQHCDAVVMPSLTEGFGLPVIEGMREGKPVFMSRATSLPEVGGPLGFYWDSYEPEHMADVFTRGMAAVRRDESYGDKLRAHAARFSWAVAAKAYLELYAAIGN